MPLIDTEENEAIGEHNDRKVRKIYISTSSKGLDGFRFFFWTVLERNPEGFKTIRKPFERCCLRFP